MINSIFLIFFITFNLFIIFYYKKFQNLMYKKFPREFFKNNLGSFLSYIDKFYVKNIYFTVFAVIFYFSSNIAIFLFLRIRALSLLEKTESVFPIPIEYVQFQFNFLNILFNILFFITFLIAIITVKILLDVLLYNEVLKLHLYLSKHSKFYRKFKHVIISEIVHKSIDFLGKLYIFFYNISELRYKAIPREEQDDDDMTIIEYNDIYDNEKIIELSKWCVALAKVNKVFLKLFFILKVISRTFYKHFRFDSFIPYVPYVLTILFVFIDFINMEAYYIKYGPFIIYILFVIIKIIMFYKDSNGMDNIYLYEYFYNNELEYKKQRYLLNTTNDFVCKDSKEFRQLRFFLINDNSFNYLINNLQDIDESLDYKVFVSKEKGQYRRFIVILVLFMFLVYFLSNLNIIIKYMDYNITIFVVLLLVILLITTFYYSMKIHRVNSNEFEYFYDPFTLKYERKYIYTFWILVGIQIYPYWLLVIMPKIYLVFDEIIWQAYNFELIKIYTIKEKKEIFEIYFNLVTKNLVEYKELLKEFMKVSEIEKIITLDIKINEIKLLIENITYDYIYVTELLKKLKEVVNISDIYEPSTLNKIINIFMWSLIPKIVISLIPKKIDQYSAQMLYRILDKRFFRLLWAIIKAYNEQKGGY